MRSLFALSLLLAAGLSQAVVVDFELLASGANAGNLYAPGVTFSYGAVTGGPVAVGDVLTLPTSMVNQVYGSKGTLAWSPDTVGYAPGTADLFMVFGSKVSFVSLLTDKYQGESSEDVYLVALDDNYTVLDVMKGQDGAVGPLPSANYLSVSSATPFQYALFVATTEQEGIDDLTYTPVPEPVSLVLGAGALGLALKRRRKA